MFGKNVLLHHYLLLHWFPKYGLFFLLFLMGFLTLTPRCYRISAERKTFNGEVIWRLLIYHLSRCRIMNYFTLCGLFGEYRLVTCHCVIILFEGTVYKVFIRQKHSKRIRGVSWKNDWWFRFEFQYAKRASCIDRGPWSSSM